MSTQTPESASIATILNVNDDEANRYSLTRMLMQNGFRVLEAETGQQALALAKQGIDLAVLDVMLPDINGIELCRRLKADPAFGGRPVVHLSAVATRSEDKAQGIESGADAYFVQPVPTREFLAVIRSLIKASRSAEALRESEERFRLLVERVTDYAIFSLSPDGRVVTWNIGAERILGFRQDEVLGAPIDKFYPSHEIGREPVLDRLSRAARDGQLMEEGARVRANGESFWALSTITALRDAKGRLQGFSKVLQDVSQRKRFEDELSRLKDVAEEANRLKSVFLANMSHEIRTPLSVVLGYADLLRQDDVAPEQRNAYLDTIQRNGQQLLALIEDILDLSKVEAGRVQIQRDRFDLRDLFADLLLSFGPKAEQKGIAFRVEFDSLVPETIEADLTRTKQILTNLIGNAVKFTDRGEVKLSVSFADARLRMRIADTGAGMAEGSRAKLFQPFVQLPRPALAEKRGTGLGLALSRKLAHALEGDVFLLRSKLGEGSEFEFDLPVEPLAGVRYVDLSGGKVVSPSVAPTLGIRANRLAGLRILVAEDTLDIQELILILLRAAGAHVELATNGVEAVERARSGEHDVVLMDIQMPLMNGYEATRKLRSLGYRKPILALTAFAMSTEQAQALAAGCNDHIAKPVNIRLLIEKIEAQLSKRVAARVGLTPSPRT